MAFSRYLEKRREKEGKKIGSGENGSSSRWPFVSFRRGGGYWHNAISREGGESENILPSPPSSFCLIFVPVVPGRGEKIERADEQCKHALALFSSSSPNHLNVFSFFAAIQSAEEEEGHSAGGGGKWFLFTPGKLPEKFGISISGRAA